MKFYNSIGPNPRVVKMFMAEKGLDIPRVEVDLRGGENRQAAYLAKNPSGQLPALELDDGVVIAEILPICEYLEEIHPAPALIGTTAEERAVTRMWTRRIDLNICEPLANGFRFAEGLRLFENRVHCIPQAADDLKAVAREKLTWLDGLMAGENRQEPYLSKNPAGQMPALELDDGTVICEILPICEYLDETHPNPPLVGTNPEERAVTRMWVRRIDLNICEPMANGFRFAEGLGLFQNRIRCIPQAADDLKAITRERLAWLDGLIAGRQWIVGDRFTLADILLFVFLEFGAQVGQPLDAANKNIAAWKDRVAARPSAKVQ